MKASTILLAPLLASAIAVPLDSTSLDKRQFEAFAGLSQPVKAPFSVKKLTPQYNPKATRELILYGPYKLSPKKNNNTADSSATGVFKLDSNSNVFSSLISGYCTDCMVLSAQSKVMDKDGKKLDIKQGVYTHHVLMTSIGKMQALSPAVVKCDNNLNLFGGFDSLGLIPVGPGFFGQNTGGSSHSHGGMGMKTIAAENPQTSALSSMASGAGSAVLALASGALLTIAGAALTGLGAAMLVTGKVPEVARGASVFMGAGAEGSENVFAANSSSIKTGYLVQKKDKILMSAEVINYDPIPKDVYLSFEYEYMPRSSDFMDVSMAALNVDGCAKSLKEAMKPPQDKPKTFESPEWIVIQDGYLVKMIPHLHDGGVNLSVFLNGKPVCKSSAIYGGGQGTASLDGQKWDTITAYSECTEPVRIRAGDKLTLSAYYDLTKYRLRPSSVDHQKEAEAMGLALFWFAKDLPAPKA